MHRRFLERLRLARDRREAHDAAWATSVTPTAGALGQFSHNAAESLRRNIAGIQFEERGQAERYLFAKIPGTEAVVYLYDDGAQIHEGSRELFWAEHHDYATPEELISSLVEVIKTVRDSV